MATNFNTLASLRLVPSSYATGKLYSVKPDTGLGDFTAERNSTATRVNSDGLIEQIGIDVPRVNYPTCPSYLAEPSRVNTIINSETFLSGWSKSGVTGATTNVISPSGGQAVKMTEDTSDAPHYVSITPVVTEGNTYSKTLYLKYNGRQYVRVYGGLLTSVIDVVNGTIFSGEGEIVDFGNGWWKYTETGTHSNDNNYFRILLQSDETTTSYLGDGTSGVYVYGPQYEEGDYPTTYIPTGSSTVTRAVDSSVLSDLIVNGFLSATEGCVYYESTLLPESDNTRDKTALNYTSDGNMTTWVNGVNTGTVVAAPPTSFSLPTESSTYEVRMFNMSLTDEQLIELTT